MQLIQVPIESLFQALADPTRLRIVRLLTETGEETCLCELVDSLLETQYNLSRHLKTLRQAGLLKSEKDGRWVYHRLLAEGPHMAHLLEAIRALPDRSRIYAADLKRFRKRLCLREGGRCRVGIVTEDFKAAAS